MRSNIFALGLVAGIGFAATAWAQAQPAQPAAPQRDLLRDPIREISKIAGEVYRFRNNFHYTVFAVTPAGVIATDPINKGAAEWLKAEIKSRFNQQVRYLVYSHDHADHISGGEVFAADGAIVIAHENAKIQVVGEKRPTAVPQVTFSERMTLELGGSTVELLYLGKNHSDNTVVMHFPRERLIFTVDWIPVQSIAFRDFPDAYIADWIDGLRKVEAMDFDILAPGHGPLGNKQSVRDYRLYMEDLRGQVLKLVREGKSRDEAKQLVDIKKYSAATNFEQMWQLNIEGMYNHVTATRRPN